MSSNGIVPLEQALADIHKKIEASQELSQHQLQMQAERFRTDAQALRENVAHQAAAPQKTEQQTVTFYLKSVDPLEVAQVLNQMLTGDKAPTITANKAAKTVTVTGSTATLDLVKNVIATADRTSKSEPLPGVEYLAPTVTVQSRDRVAVTITGEPELSASVAQDGTIRLPFLGAINVVGLNSSQIREAIGKRMAEKKLGSADQVTVRVSRIK